MNWRLVMMKRIITLILLVVFCLTGSAFAAYDIILISEAQAPGSTEEGTHEDDALVAWLESLGYTVDTSGMGGAYIEGQNPFDDPVKVEALETAGLVMFSRRTNSGNYDSDRKDWNGLTSPLLLMSGGYLTRGEASGTRWGWTTGGSGDASLTETQIELYGIVVETFFDWSEAPTPGTAPKSVYLPNKDGSSEFSPEAIVFATFDDRAMMALMEPGIDLDALNGTTDKYGVLAGRRGLIGHWGYDIDLNYGEGDPRNRRASWDDFITDGYKAALEDMVAELIPEPATIALLGLGGLVLLRRRR